MDSAATIAPRRSVSARLRPLALWTCFVILVGGVALLVTFPYDLLQARILAFLAARSGWGITAEQWSLAWPPGFRWHQVTLTPPGSQPIQAEAFQLTVSPDLFLKAVPGSDVRLILRGTTEHPGGELRCRLTLGTWSEHGSAHLIGTLVEADITHWGIPHATGGLAQASFEHSWNDVSSQSAFLQGEGTWRLAVSQLSVDLVHIGSLTLPGIAVSKLNARLHCKDGGCPIEELGGEGPDGSLTGEGLLAPRLPVETSTLTMWLSVTAGDGLAKRLDPSLLQIVQPGTAFKVTLNGPVTQLRATL